MSACHKKVSPRELKRDSRGPACFSLRLPGLLVEPLPVLDGVQEPVDHDPVIARLVEHRRVRGVVPDPVGDEAIAAEAADAVGRTEPHPEVTSSFSPTRRLV